MSCWCGRNGTESKIKLNDWNCNPTLPLPFYNVWNKLQRVRVNEGMCPSGQRCGSWMSFKSTALLPQLPHSSKSRHSDPRTGYAVVLSPHLNTKYLLASSIMLPLRDNGPISETWTPVLGGGRAVAEDCDILFLFKKFPWFIFSLLFTFACWFGLSRKAHSGFGLGKHWDVKLRGIIGHPENVKGLK